MAQLDKNVIANSLVCSNTHVLLSIYASYFSDSDNKLFTGEVVLLVFKLCLISSDAFIVVDCYIRLDDSVVYFHLETIAGVRLCLEIVFYFLKR